MTNPAPADDITLPAMPEPDVDGEVMHQGICHTYPVHFTLATVEAYARAAVIADRASPSRAAAAHPWIGRIVEIDYETSRFTARYEGIPPDIGTALAGSAVDVGAAAPKGGQDEFDAWRQS